MPKRITLASLAAHLGVSTTTVSNAYNKPDQLAPATRQRILAAAAKLGYPGPDPTARSLRTRRAGAIGVLLTEDLTYAFEDMASVDFLAGVAAACSGTGTTLTLIPAGAASVISQAAVDGFVVYSVAADDPYLDAARARHLPVVVCDQPKDSGLPFVGIDDRAAIKPAAQALVDAGHTRVGILSIRLFREPFDGFVTDPARADMHVQRERVLGAMDVLGEVPVVTRHVNTPATARAAAAALLDAHPDLTAVLCTTDSMALGVLDVAAARGISVPGQLAVTGFDGIATALLRGLSTVIQPNHAKGLAAGQMLLELIAAGGQPQPVVLGTKFQRGGTI
ncbi:LacI family transcriptional regulator [Corynebacterium phocae]|uniref:LacI family transcriptional regulator n=1 Tax=Corynebacterium phocae TaxID=161895 RepID=A0A1L7D1T2_9CORY|nr:LacI family DNA-binding transcriptional regulator [Corynebacterium phocae]APT91921.1 LacI family transcriptional regulator [Corynebacterium phocae]KAA8727377.1 substrate-binding domain-containing protein [Corynebacterium phocae]